MAGKGGGAWKVAYADFVTAMMAFFMVMWITAQNKPVREAIAGYFKDPYGSARGFRAESRRGKEGSTSVGPMKSGRGAGRGLAKQHSASTPSPTAKGAAASKPSLFVLHDANQPRTGTIIFFAEQSAELDANGQEQLRDLVPLILGKANKIEVRGHASRLALPADSQFADAWQLSYARALAVMKFLASEGIDPDRIRLSQAGVHEPYTLRGGPSARAQNSRVEVYALSEYVHEFQGTDEERAEQVWDTSEGNDSAAAGHTPNSGSSDTGHSAEATH